MRRGSLLAGLRPRDDESETELDDQEAPESEAPKPPKKARAAPSQKGVPKPSPAETRALDARIFAATDKLEAKLGRAPTHPEIVLEAKVPGPTDGARRQRVSVAMRRRGLLAEPAKPAKATKAAKAARSVPPAPLRPAVASTLIEALVAERERLAGIVARLDATIADLGGTP